MADQLDMFGTAPASPPAPSPAPVMIVASPAPARPAPSDETLRAMSALTLLREIDGGRVVLGHTGWNIAMARHQELVRRQLHRTLCEGEGLALAVLARLQIMVVGHDDSGVFVPADEFAGYQNALDGLRCAAPARVA